MIDLTTLHLPDGIRAILWDMDGVLIDSLTLDLQICGPLIQSYTDQEVSLTREMIASGFHLSAEDFLPYLAGLAGVTLTPEQLDDLVARYNARRAAEIYPLAPNIPKVLDAARRAGLAQAVVSNNATSYIDGTLTRCGLRAFIDAIAGNDIPGIAKKPAPDMYLHAAKMLDVPPHRCAVVEDSLPGTAAGRAAGAYVVGVATGAASLEELERADTVDAAYASFADPAPVA